jgi:hypothetical protein
MNIIITGTTQNLTDEEREFPVVHERTAAKSPISNI